MNGLALLGISNVEQGISKFEVAAFEVDLNRINRITGYFRRRAERLGQKDEMLRDRVGF